MKRLLGFVVKEFIHIFRDPRTVIVLFGIPVVQILLFGFVIKLEINDSNIAILDLSKDEVSLSLSDRLCSSGFFRLKENLHSYNDIDRVLRSGKVKSVIVFGEDFGRDLAASGKASLSIIADGTEPNYATLVCNYATAIVNDFSREQNELNAGVTFAIQPEVRMFYNPELKDQFMFVPGVMAFVLILISALMTSIAITREKEFGTMEVLLVSPLRAGHIIVGKVVPYMVLSFITVLVILWMSWLVFELPIRGSLWLLIGVSMLYILLGLSLGIFISTVSNNMQQAIFISLMSLLLPTIILSGFIFPVENMPYGYGIASYLVPGKYYLIAIKNIMIKGLGIGYVWKETLVMSLMSAFFIWLSINSFKKKDYSRRGIIAMRTVLYLIRKEFKQIFRDVFLGKAIIGIPILQLLIFVPAVTLEIKRVDLCVIDRDMTAHSRQLLSAIQSSGVFRITRFTQSEDEANSLLHSDKNHMAIQIPSGFGRDIGNGHPARIMVSVNAINAMTAQLSWVYLSGIVNDMNMDIALESVGKHAPTMLKQVEVTHRIWYNEMLNYKHFMLPGILTILISLIGMVLGGINLVKEKEIGTIEQINVTPIKKHQFILSKMIPFLLISLFDLAFGLILGKLFFNMPFVGSIGLLFLSATIYLVGIMGLTLLISIYSHSQQQFLFVAFFFFIIFMLMGGIFTPTDSMPLWAQKMNYFNPMMYQMRVTRMVMLKGSGLMDVGKDLLALLIFGVMLSVLAVRGYRKVA